MSGSWKNVVECFRTLAVILVSDVFDATGAG